MKEIFKAITQHFNTLPNDLNTSLSGQLYPHEANQAGTTFPYGVYFLISDMNDYDFTDSMEIISIQISLYSDKNSPAEIFGLFDELKALFDDAKLTVDNYNLLRFERTMATLDRDEQQNTWAYNVEYDVLLEQGRT